MGKNNIEGLKKVLAENEKLKKENKNLQQQLNEAKEAIGLIKTDNVDALVVAKEKELKIYTENSADKIYRILIEKMHEGAVTLNKNGIILYCNSCFANMVSLPLQKVIGTPCHNFIEDSSKEHFEVLLKQGWENYINDEIYIKGKDAKAIPVLMSINTLSLENNLVLSIILTDLTIRNKNQEELKRRANQLEQKSVEIRSTKNELAFQGAEKDKQTAELNIANADVKELGDLNIHKESILATLSHDLRSPLTGIIGVAEHLKEGFEKMDNSKVKEMLDLLHKASTDELNMLDSLVEWARIKYASEAFTPVKIMLSEYVKKVFDTLNENALQNNLQLLNKVEENTNVFADEKMLLSILQNIVSNSIKHTRSGGTITVTAKRKEDKIIVEIKDTGIGMSKEIKEKLFTPQIKSLSSAREDNKGAGIGLLLVKGFVEKNGGEIWVESVEGTGSSFYFTLPVDKISDKADRTFQI